MLVEKVDGFDSETCEAGVASAADILRRTVQTPDAVGAMRNPNFVATTTSSRGISRRKSPKQFFIFVWPVDFGSVEKIAAELQVAVKDFERFVVVAGP